MKTMLNLTTAIACTLILSACATGSSLGAGKEPVETFPQERDAAAQFLASSKGEQWTILLDDDGAGNIVLVNPKRIDPQANGINAIWQKMVFPQPIPLSAQNPMPIVGTLMYTEVKCSDNTYRTSAYYAVNEKGVIVEVIADARATFAPLDAGALALSIYHLACER